MTKAKTIPPPRRRTLQGVLRCAVVPVVSVVCNFEGLPGGWACDVNIQRFPGEDAWQWFAVVPEKVVDGHGAKLVIVAEGYETYALDFALPTFAPGIPAQVPDPVTHVPIAEVTLTLAHQASVLEAILVDQLWFKTVSGRPWTQIGCSDFRLLQRFLIGDDIRPLLAERAACGFNQLRVFLMCDLMFKLYPQTYPDFFPRLQAFLQLLAVYGLGAELTVLVDATRVMPAVVEQVQFWLHVGDAVRGIPGVMLELVNENDQGINAVAVIAFPRITGVLCSRGSNGADAPPVGCSWNLNPDGSIAGPRIDLPPWDYVSQHPSRPADWPRRVGHNTMQWADATHTPATTNETCRPDQGRGAIPSDFFDAAANAALLCAGATFHSDSGKFSKPFTAAELACAKAWVQGALAVPQDYRKGRYIAGHLSGFPVQWAAGDSSRAHGRELGNRACLSLPQLNDNDRKVVGINGWHVVTQTGSVVECAR